VGGQARSPDPATVPTGSLATGEVVGRVGRAVALRQDWHAAAGAERPRTFGS